ncbi:hypothetical protein L6452_26376 [Arctium lappa]|uniref:Uncharacterized protein n=1 Tax=Arctium lappa TaxID=4217 RepID=A0ACB9AC68_ARCLA|nr:hypothetical protein L6452_26376 [Arctium lappa]
MYEKEGGETKWKKLRTDSDQGDFCASSGSSNSRESRLRHWCDWATLELVHGAQIHVKIALDTGATFLPKILRFASIIYFSIGGCSRSGREESRRGKEKRDAGEKRKVAGTYGGTTIFMLQTQFCETIPNTFSGWLSPYKANMFLPPSRLSIPTLAFV